MIGIVPTINPCFIPVGMYLPDLKLFEKEMR